MCWNSLWYLQGGGGTTATVILGAAALVDGISGELVDNTLEGTLVEPLEAVIEE